MTDTSLLSSPFLPPRNSVTRIMLWVMLALVPGISAQIYFFGSGVLINILFAAAAALLAEAVVMQLRKRPVLPTLFDGSALLTAVLLAISIPPLTSWWVPVIGAAFAIIIAKQLYGGLGYNPFNPAMIGYAMLLIAFPQEMTRWMAPHQIGTHSLDFMQVLTHSLSNNLPTEMTMDAITMASPLDSLRTQLMLNQEISSIFMLPQFGQVSGIGWEWVNGMFLLGGLVLLSLRIISWHIPVAFLLALGGMALITHIIDPTQYATPTFHLFSGATMLAAFFIATDPVSASTTPRGKLIYAGMIGIVVFIIRAWGGYPDGVAFAVLLLNMAVPTIDQYTQPRVFGHGK